MAANKEEEVHFDSDALEVAAGNLALEVVAVAADEIAEKESEQRTGTCEVEGDPGDLQHED